MEDIIRQNQLKFKITEDDGMVQLDIGDHFSIEPEYFPEDFSSLGEIAAHDPKLILAFQLAHEDLKAHKFTDTKSSNSKPIIHSVNKSSDKSKLKYSITNKKNELSRKQTSTNNVDVYERLSKPKNYAPSPSYRDEGIDIQPKVINDFDVFQNVDYVKELKKNTFGDNKVSKSKHREEVKDGNDLQNLFNLIYSLNELLNNLKVVWNYHLSCIGKESKFLKEEVTSRSIRLKRIEATKKRTSMEIFMIRTIMVRVDKKLKCMQGKSMKSTDQLEFIDKMGPVIRQTTGQATKLTALLRDLDCNAELPLLFHNLVQLLSDITQSIKRTLSDFTALCESQDFRKLKADLVDFIEVIEKHKRNRIDSNIYNRLNVNDQLNVNDSIVRPNKVIPKKNKQIKKLKKPTKSSAFRAPSIYRNQIGIKKSRKIIDKKPIRPQPQRQKFLEPTLSFKTKIQADKLTNRNWDGNTRCDNRTKSSVPVSNRLGMSGRSDKRQDIKSPRNNNSIVKSPFNSPPRNNIHQRERDIISNINYFNGSSSDISLTNTSVYFKKEEDIYENTTENKSISKDCEETITEDLTMTSDLMNETTDTTMNIGNTTAQCWIDKINKFEMFKDKLMEKSDYNYIEDTLSYDADIAEISTNAGVSDYETTNKNIILELPKEDQFFYINENIEINENSEVVDKNKDNRNARGSISDEEEKIKVYDSDDNYEFPEHLKDRLLKQRNANIRRAKLDPPVLLIERMADNILDEMLYELNLEFEDFTNNLVESLCDNEFCV